MYNVTINRRACGRLHCGVQGCRGGQEGGVSAEDPHQAHLLQPTHERRQDRRNHPQHARAVLPVVRTDAPTSCIS